MILAGRAGAGLGAVPAGVTAPVPRAGPPGGTGAPVHRRYAVEQVAHVNVEPGRLYPPVGVNHDE